MILDIDFCTETANTWKVIGVGVSIVKIMVPILITITGMIPFFKAITKGTPEELMGAFKTLLFKILAGFIVFLTPTIITATIELLVDYDDDNSSIKVCTSCVNSPNGGVCEGAINNYKSDRKKKKDMIKDEEEKIKGSINTDDLNDIGGSSDLDDTSYTPDNPGNENGGGNNQSGGNTQVGDSNNNVANGTNSIIIGDSRTVGMCATLTGDWKNCQFSVSGGKKNGKDVFIAQGSMSYSWFNNTAVPATDRILSNNSGTRYNIYSLMGVNNLLNDIKSYISKYNELASGPWKNHKIVLVAVTPVNESIEAANGYSTKNVNIESFNSQLKSGVRASNVKFCDAYSRIKNNFGTEDGLHYTADTYKNIYNIIKSC